MATAVDAALGLSAREARRVRLISGVSDGQSPAIRYACFVRTFSRERALTWFLEMAPS